MKKRLVQNAEISELKKKKLLGIYTSTRNIFKRDTWIIFARVLPQSVLPRRDLSDIESAGRVTLSGREVIGGK